VGQTSQRSSELRVVVGDYRRRQRAVRQASGEAEARCLELLRRERWWCHEHHLGRGEVARRERFGGLGLAAGDDNER